MPSAVISSAHRQPAVLLAEQLAHERCVRPGPLVLGTAFLKPPAPAVDRDRHFCYRRSIRSWATTFLRGSACRHADRTISSRQPTCWACGLCGFWLVESVFPADCLPCRVVCGE